MTQNELRKIRLPAFPAVNEKSLFGDINTFEITGTYFKHMIYVNDAQFELRLPDEISTQCRVFLKGHFGDKGELMADTIVAYDTETGERVYG